MRSIVVVATVALLAVTSAAFGHGGEDHGAPPPAISQDVAPRAQAATEEFEVVAALEGKQLVVYVDRFASNEPVANAKVEVEGAGLKGLASQSAPGTYVINLAAAMPPAKHALTISIEAGDTADLLTTTLDTSLPAAIDVQEHGWSKRIVWSLAALLLLAAGALLIVRRRKTKGIRP